jgi:DNA mismatch repair ATPase MutL
MLDSLREGVEQNERNRKERLAQILSRTRGVKQLSQGELEAVLESLEGCRTMSLTPDGRAVVRVIDASELRKMF